MVYYSGIHTDFTVINTGRINGCSQEGFFLIEAVTKENLEEYEQFIAHHPQGLFMHSSKWAKVKSSWKWEALLCRNDDGKIKGSAAVLIRSIPVIHFTLLYCCRGFCCDPHDFATIDELFGGLKELAKQKKGYVIKIDPEIPVEETAFSDHLKQLGFRHLGVAKNFENVQPEFVYCFDYQGRSEEELMMSFKADYRNRIRKSERKGVEVKICGKEGLDDFIRLMRETGERDGFSTRPVSYFASILENLGDDCRLYMAYLNGEAIAGTIAIRFSRTMKYQYGASSNAHRNAYPNYLLQWRMIQWGLESGCEKYDFGGISGDLEDEANHLYGLYRFKRGFNGYVEQFVGEFDYVIHPMINRLYHLAEKIRKKL